MKTLIKLEILRALRNRKFMFFSVHLPGRPLPGHRLGGDERHQHARPPDRPGAYYMVAMAAFGAMTAVLMGNSERIAKEREKGWVRQLRLTALPGRGYVIAKIAAAATVSLPSILVVLLVGGRRQGRTAGRLAVGWPSPVASGRAAWSSPRSAWPSATSPPATPSARSR